MKNIIILEVIEEEEGAAHYVHTSPLAADSLRQMQAHIGGLVDCVTGETPSGSVDVWVADELTGHEPINVLATVLTSRIIRGNAVVTCVDDEGNTTGLDADRMEDLLTLGEAVSEAFDRMSEELETQELAADLIQEAESWLNE